MAGVIIPATGIGTLQPLISSDQVTADSSWVENVQLVAVAAGVMKRLDLPDIGTAGVSSPDVISIQGITSGTPIPITGSISVTGTMPVSAAVTAPVFVRLSDGTNPIATLPVSIASGGGGAQFAEDVASVGGELMTLAGTVRSDTPAGTTSTDGDYANLKTDSVGRLWTQVGASALPAGAATAAKQPALGTAGSASTDVLTIQGIASGTAIPISAAALPLPAGAATAAKQPALGTAGSAATDVITIQGIAAGTVVPISVATIPSHAVTNAGTFAIQDSQKIIDNNAFADGTTPVQPVGFIYDEVAGGTPLGEDDAGAARIDLKRAVVISIEDSATRGQRTNVILGDTGFNGLPVYSAPKAVAFTTGVVAAVASTDAGGYSWVSVQITSQGVSSTINFQGSNDNSTWVAVPLGLVTNVPTGDANSTTSTGVMFSGPLMYRYFRLNVTGIASGTTAGTVQFLSMARGRTPISTPFTAADANTGAVSLNQSSLPYTYNGTSWDMQRGNRDNISLLASAARTTTQTVADQTNHNARGVMVVLDVTSVGTGSVTLEIDMKDPVSGKYVPLLTGAAVVTNSTNIYTVYPGATPAANLVAGMPLPRTWRVVVTANNANSVTYSVGASVIL